MLRKLKDIGQKSGHVTEAHDGMTNVEFRIFYLIHIMVFLSSPVKVEPLPEIVIFF